MKRKTKLSTLYLILITAIMYIPIVVTIVYSFNASRLSSVWGGFSLSWYEELFRDRDLFRALRSSIVLAIASCLISGVIGTLGAIGVRNAARAAGTEKRWEKIVTLNGIISYISRLPIMIPEIILGMVYLAVFSFLNLPFGMLTLILAHISFCIPYVFMMVSDRLVGMDPQIEEAARDLGAGSMRVFFDITLPSIMPAILSGLLLSFAMSFDDVVISIFVTGAQTTTLPIKIYTRMKTGITPEINALATIMIAVTVVVLLLSRLYQRRHEG